MINPQIEGLMTDIAKAARSKAFDWPGTLDEGDLISELYLRLAESPASVDKLLGLEPGQRVYRLKRMANQIASKARTDLDHFSGNFNYSVNEVKKLLSAGALDRNMEQFNTQVHDLREAFKVLRDQNENYANAIYQRYVLEVAPSGNHLSRGLTKLADLMNRAFNKDRNEYENGGGRFSNLKAVKVTDGDYEGYDTFEFEGTSDGD